MHFSHFGYAFRSEIDTVMSAELRALPDTAADGEGEGGEGGEGGEDGADGASKGTMTSVKRWFTDGAALSALHTTLRFGWVRVLLGGRSARLPRVSRSAGGHAGPVCRCSRDVSKWPATPRCSEGVDTVY